jgi:hypothetical protein
MACSPSTSTSNPQTAPSSPASHVINCSSHPSTWVRLPLSSCLQTLIANPFSLDRTLPLLHGLPRRLLSQTTPERRLRARSHQELHGVAVGAIHKLQICAHGAPRVGCQYHFSRLELLSEFLELWGWQIAEPAAGSYQGGRRAAAFVDCCGWNGMGLEERWMGGKKRGMGNWEFIDWVEKVDSIRKRAIYITSQCRSHHLHTSPSYPQTRASRTSRHLSYKQHLRYLITPTLNWFISAYLAHQCMQPASIHHMSESACSAVNLSRKLYKHFPTCDEHIRVACLVCGIFEEI